MTFHHQVKMTPSALRQVPGDGDAVRLVCAQGISTRHELYLDYGSNDPAVSNGRLLYLVFPDSGPMPALQRWARTETDVAVWDLPPWDGGKNQAESMRIQLGASEFVLHAALDEVAAECDLPSDWKATSNV